MARFYQTASRGADGSPRVFLATQAYEHTATSHDISLLGSTQKLDEAGIPWERYVIIENCHVDDCRNAVLREFIRSGCSDLVFLDADVFWDPDDLVKLLRFDRDIVAGVYPKRAKNQDYPVFVRPGTALYADKDGLVEVDGVPAGFLRIRRNVIEKLNEAYKHQRYLGQDGSLTEYTILFERVYETGARWGGDYEFCRKAKKHGFKVYVDPEMYLGHEGAYPYYGTLGQHWREKHGLDDLAKQVKLTKALEVISKPGAVDVEAIEAAVEAWDNPYAATSELLTVAHALAQENKGPILECGSGLSTLVMAYANPNVTIYALENDPVWASRLTETIEELGIKNIVLLYRSLKEYSGGRWYDIKGLPTAPYSLVLCDGPKRNRGNRHLLYPIVGSLIETATVIMDDAADPLQLQPFEQWMESRGGSVKVMGSVRQFAIGIQPKVTALSSVA